MRDTYATLHMWSQVIGKVAVVLAPPVNHSWGVSLQVTARGLSTRPLPHGSRSFTMAFDFIDHQLVVDTSDGHRRVQPLEPRTVADFYSDVMAMLQEMALPVKIWPMPVDAFYHPELAEFVLPYEAVRTAASPDAAIIAFVDSTYGRGASLGGWDAALEVARPAGRAPV